MIFDIEPYSLIYWCLQKKNIILNLKIISCITSYIALEPFRR